jgi:ParB-like chromosome segregation protein Spo0J
MAKGLDSQAMEELRLSIQRDGLDTPLRLRITGLNKLECVNGERRFRSLQRLTTDQEDCYDPYMDEMKPAGELYEWIYCRITRLSDEEAVKLALIQETGSTIGDYAAINVVRMLRECGLPDEEILMTINKSVTWLRETDQLLSLDKECLEALLTDNINRKVAIRLSKITELDIRIERLGRVQQHALERICEQQQNIQKQIEEDEAQVEIGSGEIHLAKLDGDENEIEEATERVSEVKERLDRHTVQSEKLDDRATGTTKDWDATREDDESRPLTASKIEKFWLRPLLRMIHDEGKNEEGEDLGIDLHDAKLFQSICEAQLQGKRESDGTPLDPAKILKLHNRNR